MIALEQFCQVACGTLGVFADTGLMINKETVLLTKNFLEFDVEHEEIPDWTKGTGPARHELQMERACYG